MKFITSLLLISALSSFSLWGNTVAIPLWPNGAPEAKGVEIEHHPHLLVHQAKGNLTSDTAVLVLPGGGYGGLAMDHEGKQIAEFYNSIGIHAFILPYRHGKQGYHHPIPLNDAKRALRWIRSNAAMYNINPERIGVQGFSAGGHLASSLATEIDAGQSEAEDRVERVSSRPNFLVLGYPVIHLNSSYAHRGSRNNLLGPDQANDAKAEQLSTHLRVTKETPPTFLFLTNEDTVVPPENSIDFYLALRKHQIPTEMHIYQFGPHGVGLRPNDPALSTWSQLLEVWLKQNQLLMPTKIK